MAFDIMGKLLQLKELLTRFTRIGVERSQKALAEANTLLDLLQKAGYEISEMEVILSLPPTMTIHMNTSLAAADGEDKLKSVLQDSKDNRFVSAILTSLMQANKFRGGMKVQSLELKDVKIVLSKLPKITLEWKAKAKETALGAVA
jgi:hypothetical protein